MKSISLQQIAQELGVSRITVSKVLNGKGGVSEETMAQVAKKLVDSGYKKIPPFIRTLAQEAAALPPPVAGSIAVVAAEPEVSDFWLKIINGIASELSANHLNLVYHFITRADAHSFRLPAAERDRELKGLIVLNVYDDDALMALSNSLVPCVFLDLTPRKYEEGVKGDVLLLEGRQTVARITKEILAKGRQRLAFIGDYDYSKTVRDRYEGFMDALLSRGLKPAACLKAGLDGTFAYPEDLLKMPEAFVCGNDVIAYQLIRGLSEKGLRVPEDVLVSGYDDIKKSLLYESELTSVEVDTASLGKRLVRQLLARLAHPGDPYETVTINPQIHFRRSTGH